MMFVSSAFVSNSAGNGESLADVNYLGAFRSTVAIIFETAGGGGLLAKTVGANSTINVEDCTFDGNSAGEGATNDSMPSPVYHTN